MLQRFAATSRRHDALDTLTQVTAPTLVQHATADSITGVDHAAARRSHPRRPLDLVPDLRHGYHFESLAAVQTVADFLRP